MKNYSLSITDVTDGILSRLSQLKMLYLMALCIFLNLLVSFIFSYYLFPDAQNPNAYLSLPIKLFAAVLLAPIIETYIIQGYVIKQSLKYFGNSKFIAIMLSSILFGVMHYFSASFSASPFMLKAVFAGFLYSLLYFSVLPKTKNPLLVVMLTHSIFNSIGFLIEYFSKH